MNVFSAVMSVALVVFCVSQTYSADQVDSDKAKKLVQAALQAEVSGDAENRSRLLSMAKEAFKAEPSSYWHVGQVRVGKEWKTYTDAVKLAKKSKVLEEYRGLRDESQPTIESQLQLANYCQKHGLKEQAKAHWAAVIEFDTDHEQARRQLGFEWKDGSWQRASEREIERANAVLVAASLQRNMPALRKIAADLQAGEVSKEKAAELISRDANPHCIPVWEIALSTDSDRGAAVVVAALDKLSAPEASLSLARHAIWANDAKVRAEAEAALRHRDSHSFIPAMLAELQGPWLASRTFAFEGYGRLIVRYSLMADGQDKQSLLVLDNIYFLSGNPWIATSRARMDSEKQIAPNEIQRKHENELIASHNAKIMSALKSITGEVSLETPQDWWQWWDEKNEVYSTGEKPIFSSYAYRESSVRVPLEFAAPSSRGNKKDEKKKDCLAGGTPILTQRGPIAIERVRIGDLVIAKHAETGEVRFCSILGTTIRDPERLIRITIEGSATGQSEQVIRASGGHPFWVSGKGWVRARELEAGMRLHGLEKYAEIKDVQLEEKSTKTYNLIVDDFHSYFVGQAAVMSHDNTAIEPVRCTVPGLLQ